MSIITRAMNADDDATILQCLRWLKGTHGGTGFMHESFNKDDPTNFTRSWFAWANALFGQLIVEIADKRPALQIGRAHVCTPVTNANLVCRLLLEQKQKKA